MADIVNLRTARKARSRAAAADAAARNRAAFGRTKAQKLEEAAQTARREKALDDHKRDR